MLPVYIISIFDGRHCELPRLHDASVGLAKRLNGNVHKEWTGTGKLLNLDTTDPPAIGWNSFGQLHQAITQPAHGLPLGSLLSAAGINFT
jgi:hypothetical protein